MVLAFLAGFVLTSAGGLIGGMYLFEHINFMGAEGANNYLRTVDYSADDDDSIPMPNTVGKPVSVFKKMLLKNTSPWLVQPDYDRLLFINTILTSLWPHLSPAIHKMAMEQAKIPLEDVCKKSKGVLQAIRIDRLDLGTKPPRVDCFKSYQTGEDELIVETPAFWGGDMSIRVTAVIKVGSKTIDLPVDVANIQFKALTRITVKPLVETLPCLGGVTVSLLEPPHFNMDLRIADSPDIMALPGVPLLLTTAINIVAGKMLVYPNEFALPLMPNFGLPPPPKGMLNVKVISAKGLKSSLLDKIDPFVVLSVREKGSVQTSTKSNNESPVWEESFDFVIDDPKQQGLHLTVKDDDLVSASTEGEAVVPLDRAAFLANPRIPVTLTLPLHAPGGAGKKPKTRSAQAEIPTGSTSKQRTTPGGTPASPTSPEVKKKKTLLQRLRRKKKPAPGDVAAEKVAHALHGELVGPGGSPHGSEGISRQHSVDAGSSLGHHEDEEGEHHLSDVDEEGGSAPSTPRIQLPAGALTGAEITVQCTYFPFKSAQPEAITPTPGLEAKGATKDAETAMITSVRRIMLAAPSMRPQAKGVLSFFFKKAMHLEGSPDTYATVTLYDPNRTPIPNIEHRTETVFNEDCPRYNFRTDFVNVSAASSITIVVYDNPGAMAALTSLKVPFLQKAKAKMLGRVRVELGDVVKEGKIADRYPLLEAQTGELYLQMQWNPIELSEADEAATSKLP